MPDSFEEMWAALLPIGRNDDGGYDRPGYGPALRELMDWFHGQAAARGLTIESDELATCTIAWWRPDVDGPGVVTGSHLDSVPDGGAYDGPLGVVAGFAALDRLRAEGFEPSRPIGVAVFAEEEGSRFGMPCLGSRVLTGEVGLDALKALRDPDGQAFLDAVAGFGIHLAPDVTVLAHEDLPGLMHCYVELHVEQGRFLDVPVGVGSGIAPHGRWRFDFAGTADHAGSTRMEDRHDPMLTFAMTVLAANKQARLSGARATMARLEVVPNATNGIPSRVTAWLDARAQNDEALSTLIDDVTRQAQQRASRDGTSVTVTAESASAEVVFDPGLVGRVADLLAAPTCPTYAGHDAGELQQAGIPTVMLFVRNPTGVSHSPAEHASEADCLAGVDALTRVLAELAR